MNAWLNLLRDLFRFRRGPADVPHSPTLLSMLLVLMVVIDIVSTSLLYQKPFSATSAAVNVAIGMLLLYALLRVNGKQARFVQTATAMLLTRLVIVTLTGLVMLGAAPYPIKPEHFNPQHLLLATLSMPLVVWYIALRVHIVRHALDIPVLRGLVAVLLMTTVHLLLLGLLLPEPT